MIRRLALVPLCLALTLAGPARGDEDPVRSDEDLARLLLLVPDPAALRHDLAVFARGLAPADSVTAGAAWALIANSYHRAGLADSAIVCGEHAVARHADAEALDALIDAYVVRQGASDVARARELLDRRADILRFDAGPWDDANTQGRLAWALFLAGNADSANRLFTHQRQLDDETNPMYWVWRRRMAIVAKAARARSRALDLAKQLCVRSLLQDRDAVKLLHDILGSDNADQHYAPFVRSDLVRAMQLDAARLEEIHARRVSAAGADGFPLAAMLFDPPAHARHVVLAIGRPDLQLTVCDSLAAGFARAGYAFAVMDPRGSGRSLGPGCATPESWDGREAALEHTSATDVRRVFDAVAKELGADTTGYAVMATLTGCVIAVEAATLDRRVRALVLASPAPPRVELGRVAARLQKNRPAVFFQTTPSEPVGVDVAAQLYGFVDPKTSRLVDSEQAGDDVSIFVMDTTALPRLTGWLSASWTVRSAPRPAPRRKG